MPLRRAISTYSDSSTSTMAARTISAMFGITTTTSVAVGSQSFSMSPTGARRVARSRPPASSNTLVASSAISTARPRTRAPRERALHERRCPRRRSPSRRSGREHADQDRERDRDERRRQARGTPSSRAAGEVVPDRVAPRSATCRGRRGAGRPPSQVLGRGRACSGRAAGQRGDSRRGCLLAELGLRRVSGQCCVAAKTMIEMATRVTAASMRPDHQHPGHAVRVCSPQPGRLLSVRLIAQVK